MESAKLKKIVEKKLDTVVGLMNLGDGVTVSIKMQENDGRSLAKIRFDGNDLGYLIGPRGRHLQSIQFILKLIINKDLEEGNRCDILMDAGGYIDERIEKLESLAYMKADDARIAKGEIELRPMSAFERKIIHMALSKFDDVRTESVGEGEDRRLKIIPTDLK